MTAKSKKEETKSGERKKAKSEQPEAPDTVKPQAKKRRVPAAKKSEQPEAPVDAKPQTKKRRVSAAKKSEQPEAPDAVKPQTKKRRVPAAKKSEQPEAPDAVKPQTKKRRVPAAIKPVKRRAKPIDEKETKKTVRKTKPAPKKKEVKLTRQEIKKMEREKAAQEAAKQRTFEEELEEQLTDEEIKGFTIERVDMEKLTNKVCEILAKYESDGMFQNDLWKKLKLSGRDGSRLSLKLERAGIINRVKLLQKERWTYKLILKKTPISTMSIENAPCLVCPVEQKCSLDGEISPRTCQWIDDWVIAEMKRKRSR